MIVKRLLLPGVLLTILALLALNLTTSLSRAAPSPLAIDLVGTYEGMGEETGAKLFNYEEFTFSMEITEQRGHLFCGVMNEVQPITGAVMSLEGSATAVVVRWHGDIDASASGSITVVSGRGNKPDQVVVELLATGLTDGRHWSAYAKAVKRPEADFTKRPK